ncbi:hypothetical protein CEQ90_19500 [Lewinellaceae bacterium SD302]|nr:hypothetical protein CEQ90_19500 [Lewinellaceae bacterium SD302]
MTSKKHSLLFAFLLLAGFLAAGNDPIVVKSNPTATGMSVVLANLQGVSTTVKLKSLTNHAVLHTETVNDHNGYSCHFDLENLDFGRYYLEITKGDVVKRQVLVVGENGVLLSSVK